MHGQHGMDLRELYKGNRTRFDLAILFKMKIGAAVGFCVAQYLHLLLLDMHNVCDYNLMPES